MTCVLSTVASLFNMHFSSAAISVLLLSTTSLTSAVASDKAQQIMISSSHSGRYCFRPLHRGPGFGPCSTDRSSKRWIRVPVDDKYSTLQYNDQGCLTYNEQSLRVAMSPCNSKDQRQHWEFYRDLDPKKTKYKDGNFKLVTRIAQEKMKKNGICLTHGLANRYFAAWLEECDYNNDIQYLVIEDK
ncbi:hypothetical protein BDF22DRAFT_670841 [Syncephalis plumigaleata]|nr:hypothetical protein BDF22DRAFT_670841 [Syncephalis plumigaleata]